MSACRELAETNKNHQKHKKKPEKQNAYKKQKSSELAFAALRLETNRVITG